MEDHYTPEFVANLNELHGMLLSEETLESTLQRVTQLARASVEGCDAAGLSIVEGTKVSTAGATDDFTLKIDTDQYDNLEGPCLQAASTQEVVVMDDIASDSRWPSFVRAAKADGLGSVLSLPLSVRNEPIGALNLYSKTTRSFGEKSEELGKLFASQASVAISNASVYASAVSLTEQLREAIKTREVIGEAKGILMSQEGMTDDEAFKMLKRVSQNKNIKLREIAQRMVDEAGKKPAQSAT